MGEDGDKGVDMVMRGMQVGQVGCRQGEGYVGEVRETQVRQEVWGQGKRDVGRHEGHRQSVRDTGEG